MIYQFSENEYNRIESNDCSEIANEWLIFIIIIKVTRHKITGGKSVACAILEWLVWVFPMICRAFMFVCCLASEWYN